MSQQENHGTVGGYITGFIISIILSIIPIVLVLNHMMGKTALVFTIILIAVGQFLVQLFFFMHIREAADDGPRYNVWALVLGVFLVFVIVGGSIWIMTFNTPAY